MGAGQFDLFVFVFLGVVGTGGQSCIPRSALHLYKRLIH